LPPKVTAAAYHSARPAYTIGPDMINARSRELRAQADLGGAIADYERATGETLEKRKIDLR
jgi:hypothetical protein